MSVVAEVSVPPSALPLGSVAAEGNLEIEVERVVPTSETVLPYIWVWGDDVESVVELVESSGEFEDLVLLDTVPGGALYRAGWDAADNCLLSGLSATGVTVLECVGTDDAWTLRLRATSRATLAALRRHCESHGIDFEVTRIGSLSTEGRHPTEGLTASQREALLLALERGYFDEHRRTSLEELGRELGISRQAVAARLRRAYRHFAESVQDATVPDEWLT